MNGTKYTNGMTHINTDIPKDVKREIKVIAAANDTTFKNVVIEALIEKIQREKNQNK